MAVHAFQRRACDAAHRNGATRPSRRRAVSDRASR